MSDQFATELASAILQHRPLPKFCDELTLEGAYALQHQVTSAIAPEGAAGIKAGVTASPVQSYFGIDHPLIASLYPKSKHNSGDKLSFIEGRGIECEVAVLMDENGRPKAIAPAIEFVFVKFSEASDMSAANLVASNLGADAFLVGDFQPWKDGAFDELTAVLSRNGEEIGRADMNDAIGGPGPATEWMFNEAKARGFRVGADTLIMTGACGQAMPGEIGNYVMEIDRLGSVSFVIQ
ncbi:MAG: hypothetical protein ACON4C_11490 [Henriciella sp.]